MCVHVRCRSASCDGGQQARQSLPFTDTCTLTPPEGRGGGGGGCELMFSSVSCCYASLHCGAGRGEEVERKDAG